MVYAKATLAGVASFLGLLIIPALIHFFAGPQKATGIAVVWAGLVELLLSPLFWIEVFCIFALFLVASRLATITSIGCAVIGLMTFVVLHFRRQ